jgi:hypothetical protein
MGMVEMREQRVQARYVMYVAKGEI